MRLEASGPMTQFPPLVKRDCLSGVAFFFFLNVIGVELIYNVVLVSGVQQSASVIHIHIFILFQILFPYRSLQSIEWSSLCYTVGPC